MNKKLAAGIIASVALVGGTLALKEVDHQQDLKEIPIDLHLKAPKEKVFEKGRYTEDGKEVVKYTYVSEVEVQDESLPLTKKQVSDELKKDAKVKVKDVKTSFTEDVSMRTGNAKFFKLGKTEDDRDIVQAQIFPGLQMTKELATGKWFDVEVATTTAEVFAMEMRPTLKERALAILNPKARALTGTFYPDPDTEVTSVDGSARRVQVSEAFSTKRNGAGTAANDSASSDEVGLRVFNSSTDTFNEMIRLYFLFDTSTLGSSAVVSSAVLSLYGSGINNGMGGAGENDIVSSNPSSNTAVASSDYSSINSTVFSTIVMSSLSTIAYNDFTLNASGISAVNVTGITKLGVRENWDTDNSFGGTWGFFQESVMTYKMSETSGTSQDPKLVVTYTTGGGAAPTPPPFINFD